VVQPRTPFSAPPEPHPPAGEAAHTEVDTPHADADTASGPLFRTHDDRLSYVILACFSVNFSRF